MQESWYHMQQVRAQRQEAGAGWHARLSEWLTGESKLGVQMVPSRGPQGCDLNDHRCSFRNWQVIRHCRSDCFAVIPEVLN